MPMYFFHIHHVDGTISTDDVGAEFSSAQQAREEATLVLSEMTRELRPHIGVEQITIRLIDESGQEIARRSAQSIAEDFGE